jgi:hypothetical protein
MFVEPNGDVAGVAEDAAKALICTAMPGNANSI